MEAMKVSWGFALVKPYDILHEDAVRIGQRPAGRRRRPGGALGGRSYQTVGGFPKGCRAPSRADYSRERRCFCFGCRGLGKTYVGAAIIKHFERTENARPLIICPAPLVEMWERYNEVYHLNARVLSMGKLREDDGAAVDEVDGLTTSILDDVMYRDRDFVLIDESHNFRHSGTQRYKIVQSFLGSGRRCCFLTATPRNKSAWDVFHQIKLFHPKRYI